MAAEDDTPETGEGPLDPPLAALLAQRYRRTQRAAGPEPAGLEEVARYVDGALPPERRAAVEARLAGDAELREVVAELDKLEAAEPPSNVIPLVIPGRSLRVGDALPGLRQLPTPEPKKGGLRMALIGIGAALALAAILFLVTRPPMKTTGTTGAGIGGEAESIAVGFEPGQAVLEVDAKAGGELAVLLATPAGTRAVGLCDAKTCLVTNDTLPLRVGKQIARAVIGKDLGPCAFLLALTAERADPHAAAKALGTIVSDKTCVLEPIDHLQGVTGARHVSFIKVP